MPEQVDRLGRAGRLVRIGCGVAIAVVVVAVVVLQILQSRPRPGHRPAPWWVLLVVVGVVALVLSTNLGSHRVVDRFRLVELPVVLVDIGWAYLLQRRSVQVAAEMGLTGADGPVQDHTGGR